MKRVCVALFILALAFVPTAGLAVAPRQGEPGTPAQEPASDNFKHPLGARQAQLRQRALKQKLAGKARGRVVEVAKGQFVELEQTRNDRVFVILAEFGDQVDPLLGSPRINPGGDAPGPLHNRIPEPDRTIDNTTIWQPDYNVAHYDALYFSPEPGANSMVNYYHAQSSGRYTINGDVHEWVKVPYNGAYYGHNLCGFRACPETWDLIRDAINIWTANQLAAGKTEAEVRAYLDTFDVWDRYDYDGDGNFDEPDGYIDHFQIVHAGEGEEDGGGAQGANAIWSHRSFAYFFHIGRTGPSFNKQGGTQFGTTGVWAGDYTIQPENGGLGVFAHEYGHDLGLPDLYDTTRLAESPSAGWSLMALGSHIGDGTVDVGSRPADLGAWEKLQLGWLNYEVAVAGQRSSHRLGPAETNTRAAQGLLVRLPQRERVLELATPAEGTRAWWSGMGDDLDNTMTRAITLPAGTSSITMQVWYDIERDWDYAYVEVSEDNGTTWSSLATNLSTTTNPNTNNLGNGITGSSNGWQTLTAPFPASAADQKILLRVRYRTDGNTQGKGLLADAIAVTAGFFDGAEQGANGWTLAGFQATDGTESTFHDHYYLAEFRQYRGFDTGLRTGPFAYSTLDRPKWVDHFPYQDGLLISYWDTAYTDNDVALHPGEGLILPIDAHPLPLIRGDGRPWGTHVQVYDATFGLEPTDPISLAYASFGTNTQYAPTNHPSLPAVPAFNDRNQYWYASRPDAGVKVPATGTMIEIAGTSAQGTFMQVNVRPSK